MKLKRTVFLTEVVVMLGQLLSAASPASAMGRSTRRYTAFLLAILLICVGLAPGTATAGIGDPGGIGDPDPPEPPRINSTPITTATVGILYEYQVVASDSDSFELYYSLSVAPSGMTIDSAGLIEWTPSAEQVGDNQVTVQVSDETGQHTPQSFTVTVKEVAGGNDAPIAEANGPYRGTVGTAVTFNSSGSTDPDGVIDTYEWDFGDGATGSGPNPSHTYAAPDIYNVTLTVTDSAGVPASDAATAEIVAEGSQPVADTGGPYQGTPGVPVIFNGGGSSDADGLIVEYEWDFGDASSLGVSSDPIFAKTYDEVGIYPVTLTVTDESGDIDVDLTLVRIGSGDLPPEADAGGPYTGVVGEPVDLDGSGSSGGPFATRDWYFGDDTPDGDGEKTTHTYDAPGLYNVTYEVSDFNGMRDSDSARVLITENPDNSSPDCSLAVPSIDVIWPAYGWFVPVDILGVTDPDGDPVSITIDSIFQDEPVSPRTIIPELADGQGVGTATARVRAIKKDGGNGRVYHIGYTADDGQGGSCSGDVTVAVPPNSREKAIDDGPKFDSTVPSF